MSDEQSEKKAVFVAYDDGSVATTLTPQEALPLLRMLADQAHTEVTIQAWQKRRSVLR